MLPATMTAIEIVGGAGPASALRTTDVPLPTIAADEILIEVRAAGVNRPDILQRQGLYPPPAGASTTLGLEVAGEVAAIGRDVTRWQVGDRVTALLGGGGYAQFASVKSGHALPVPAGLDFIQAGALPETVFTVYANIVEHGKLAAGETILIHGATSGIGVMAIQLAKALGARVIATSRGADKAARAAKLGADLSIDTSREDFAEIAAAEGGVDVILDMVAGPYFTKNLEALRMSGRLVHIAFQGGASVELPIPVVMQKQLVITGSTLRGRASAEKGRLASEIEKNVWPFVEAGRIRPVVDCVFPLADAADAHARMEESSHIGKIVLTV